MSEYKTTIEILEYNFLVLKLIEKIPENIFPSCMYYYLKVPGGLVVKRKHDLYSYLGYDKLTSQRCLELKAVEFIDWQLYPFENFDDAMSLAKLNLRSGSLNENELEFSFKGKVDYKDIKVIDYCRMNLLEVERLSQSYNRVHVPFFVKIEVPEPKKALEILEDDAGRAIGLTSSDPVERKFAEYIYWEYLHQVKQRKDKI